MKKYFLIFIGLFCFLTNSSSVFAITINKAAPVAKQEVSVTDNTASLIPTVLGLVSSVRELSAKQKELTQDCIPTQQELNFVNETIKEWAKTGAMSEEEIWRNKNWNYCDGPSGGYAISIQLAESVGEDNLVCFDYFGSESDKNMVWYRFPKATVAQYCEDGSTTCSNKKTKSNIYDVFNLVDFSTKDYTASEATMAAKLIAKIEQCSSSKLSAKKTAMWGEFLMNTVGSIGQSTSTDVIMQQVSGVVGGGTGGALQSLGSIATQFLN